VIKVIWGSYWDPLLAKDKDGHPAARDGETVDGEYQNYKAKRRRIRSQAFLGKPPKALEMVAT